MNTNHYKIGPCTLDCQTQSLSRSGKVYKLSAKVFELLKLFLNSEECVVSREDAIEKIWLGNEAVGQRGFTNAIWTLRKAFKELGEDNEDVFITLPKVGYQLNLPVAEIEAKKQSKLPVKYLTIFITFFLISVALFMLNQRNDEESTTNTSIMHLEHEHLNVTNFEGIEEHPAVSHNGQYVAFQWQNGETSSGIYIKDLKNEDTPLNQVSTGRFVEASPAWSESDESLAYVRITNDKHCEVRVKHLVTNNDILIADDCYYMPYRRVLNWSKENELIYTKKLDSGAALFRFNFQEETSEQLTFPQGDEIDFAPKYLSSSSELLFIRDKSSQKFDVLLQSKNSTITPILQNKVTVIDIDVLADSRQLFVNYAEDSKFLIKQISLDDRQTQVISNRGLPSNISLNLVRGELLFANHISKEYVAKIELETGDIKRRISSSFRDMYGRLSRSGNDILFLSNRSGNWSVWLNNGITSSNLSKDLGNATVPAISPDGKTFVVSIRPKGSKVSSLYLGDLTDNSMQVLETNGLEPDNMSWSKDGLSIYFYVSEKQAAGMYKLALATGDIKQISNSGEHYLVEGENDTLYVSRLNMRGIWQLNAIDKSVTLVNDNLEASDFGAFYWQNGALYYLKRDAKSDRLQRILTDGSESTVATFAANSIRKFFGISQGNEQFFVATLKLSNESDINSVKVF